MIKKKPTYLDLLNVLERPYGDPGDRSEAIRRIWEKIVTKQITRKEFEQLIQACETCGRDEAEIDAAEMMDE